MVWIYPYPNKNHLNRLDLITKPEFFSQEQVNKNQTSMQHTLEFKISVHISLISFSIRYVLGNNS